MGLLDVEVATDISGTLHSRVDLDSDLVTVEARQGVKTGGCLTVTGMAAVVGVGAGPVPLAAVYRHSVPGGDECQTNSPGPLGMFGCSTD